MIFGKNIEDFWLTQHFYLEVNRLPHQKENHTSDFTRRIKCDFYVIKSRITAWLFFKQILYWSQGLNTKWKTRSLFTFTKKKYFVERIIWSAGRESKLVEGRGTLILLKLQADPKLVSDMIEQLHENRRPLEPLDFYRL